MRTPWATAADPYHPPAGWFEELREADVPLGADELNWIE
jgi:hypothetical protein